jgi:hypothetical protein
MRPHDRRALAGALACAALAAGCEFADGLAPRGRSVPVVHAVLNPSVGAQVILLERSLSGAVNVEDGGFLPGEPILSSGGDPISGALVIVYNTRGDSVIALEDRLTRPDGRGAGVYRFFHPAFPGPSGPPNQLTLLPGAEHRLLVVTPEGDTVRGTTIIPGMTRPAPVTSQRFNVDRDTLRFEWAPAAETRQYVMRVETPFGPFFLFTDSLTMRLPPTLRNFYATGLPRVFVPGFRQRAALAAADRNYFDYYRSRSDPFTGTGLISHIEGGIGLFGSYVPMEWRDLWVEGDVDRPIEGYYARTAPPLADPPPIFIPLEMQLWVEAGRSPARVSGSHTTSLGTMASGILGSLDGDRLTLAFLPSTSHADTLALFTGTFAGDSIAGSIQGIRVVMRKPRL